MRSVVGCEWHVVCSTQPVGSRSQFVVHLVAIKRTIPVEASGVRMRVSCVAVLLPRLLSVATRSQQVWPRKSGSQSSFNCLFGHCGAILLDRLTGRYVYMSRSLMSSANLGGEAVASTSSGSSSKSHVSYGHDRQPSVQLKIEASGGPPLSGRKVNILDLLKCSQFTDLHF